MDTSYNPASINYTNENIKDMMLEDTSQEKSLIHQKHTYFCVLLSEYSNSQNFQEARNHKDP